MRRSLLLLTTMALALLMASSVALALNRISCTGGSCYGTPAADSMSGTAGSDDMDGLGGNDKLNGGDGNDYLGDQAGTNTLNGGAGDDTFFADYANLFGGNEISKISGGSGNDFIYAGDGAKDTINCGTGYDLVSFYDPGLDVLRDCEEAYIQQ